MSTADDNVRAASMERCFNDGVFLLNAPAFANVRMRTGTSDLVIETTGFATPEPDGPVQYVQSVRVDGRRLDRSWLTSAELHAARRIQIELGPVPSSWGTTTRPPSHPTSNPATSEFTDMEVP